MAAREIFASIAECLTRLCHGLSALSRRLYAEHTYSVLVRISNTIDMKDLRDLIVVAICRGLSVTATQQCETRTDL